MARGPWWMAAATIVVLTCSPSAAQRGPGEAARTPGGFATGLWLVSHTSSEVSALPTLMARLPSDASDAGAAHPELVLRCRERVFEVFVDTKVITSGAGNRVRWDDAPAQPYDVWSELDSDARTLFTPEPEEFLRKAMKARRLRFEFKPHGGGQAVASFKLAGISGVVLKLQPACPRLMTLH
jgi:hypothetical protein